MQLDLLTKMRDNKIYENRERFARHANQPTSFSTLQMQEYLKASAFRCGEFFTHHPHSASRLPSLAQHLDRIRQSVRSTGYRGVGRLCLDVHAGGR